MKPKPKKTYRGKAVKKAAPSKRTGASSPRKTVSKAKKTAASKKYKGRPGSKPKKKNKVKFPSIQDYLMGDPSYQEGLSDLEWALEQYLTESEAGEEDLADSYQSAMGYMNLDKEKDLEYIKDDFGSRNMVFSGSYPKAVSDYNTEWSMGAADLNRDLASQMRDLGFEEQNMRQSTEMQKRDLRLDAIRRRAEEIQQSQFNNKAGYAKPSAKKTAPAKKFSSAKGRGKQYTPKSGVRKSGRR